MGLHTNVFTVLKLYGIKWEALALEHPWTTLFFYKLNAIENFRFPKDHRRKREVRGREGNIHQKSVTSLCCELLCSTTWGKPHQNVIFPQRYSISYNTWRQRRRQKGMKKQIFLYYPLCPICFKNVITSSKGRRLRSWRLQDLQRPGDTWIYVQIPPDL